MLQGRYFDVCVVDKALGMAGCVKKKAPYETLSILHCVEYADMPDELIAAIPELLADLFAGPILDVDRINIIFDQEKGRLQVKKNGGNFLSVVNGKG